MKYLKLFDVGLQALLIATGLVVVVVALVSPDWIALLLYVQLLLGPVQVISALAWFFFGSGDQRKVGHYLLAVLVYFGISLGWSQLPNRFEVDKSVMILYGILVPWMLAVYFFRLRLLPLIRTHQSSGKFLRHLQF
jgi:hypothetical protein